MAKRYKKQASVTLLRYNGDVSSLGYEPVDSVEFLSRDGLTGIALGGQPGDVGWLLLSIKGRNSVRVEFSQTRFKLEIPFKIRPCHKGFHGPVEKVVVCVLYMRQGISKYTLPLVIFIKQLLLCTSII